MSLSSWLKRAGAGIAAIMPSPPFMAPDERRKLDALCASAQASQARAAARRASALHPSKRTNTLGKALVADDKPGTFDGICLEETLERFEEREALRFMAELLLTMDPTDKPVRRIFGKLQFETAQLAVLVLLVQADPRVSNVILSNSGAAGRVEALMNRIMRQATR